MVGRTEVVEQTSWGHGCGGHPVVRSAERGRVVRDSGNPTIDVDGDAGPVVCSCCCPCGSEGQGHIGGQISTTG